MPIFRDEQDSNEAKEDQLFYERYIDPKWETTQQFETDDQALLAAVYEGLGSLRTAYNCCVVANKGAQASVYAQQIKEIESAVARKKWDLPEKPKPYTLSPIQALTDNEEVTKTPTGEPMQTADRAYKKLIKTIVNEGEVHHNRTGVDTHRIWGAMMKIDLTKGFPLLTTKKMATKAAFVELLGFVRGETDVRWYQERGCNIWNADHVRWHGKDRKRDKALLEELEEQGEKEYNYDFTKENRLEESISFREDCPHTLGVIYGAQWRKHGQLTDIIQALKHRSTSRRLIMTAWNYGELHMMCLPPCHLTYHFSLRENSHGSFVDVAMHQRSVDCALGLPFNLASTALLTHLIAHATGLTPGHMAWFGDDVHIYEPHIDLLVDQLHREPKASPQLLIKTPEGHMPWDTNYEDLEIIGYDPHPKVPFELFVG